MRITPGRIALTLAVFAAALAGGLLLLQQSGGGGGKARGEQSGDGGRHAPTSDIWAVGDEWTVAVRQDSAAITPDGDTSVAAIPFRFAVVAAPEDATGSWKLRVTQDGAEGPFAAGWRLEYREREDGTMTLHRVAMGEEPPLEAELASIVLGPQFPYETKYTAPPKDATVDAKALLDRTALPPSSLPGAGAPDSGATPPAEAPRLDAGGAPQAAPGRD